MAADTPLTDVLELLERTTAGRRLTIAAIDGCSGAGKTTLCNAIVSEWPETAIVRVDDFYRPMELVEMATLGPEQGFHRYVDWQRLHDQVLAPLVNGDQARYNTYNWRTNRISTKLVEVASQGLVVVEGVYALYEKLRDYYSVSLFVETPATIRRRRCLERSGDEFAAARERASTLRGAAFWVDLWMEAEDWYVAGSRPQEWADLIVLGG